jgi:hypothetical protein
MNLFTSSAPQNWFPIIGGAAGVISLGVTIYNSFRDRARLRFRLERTGTPLKPGDDWEYVEVVVANHGRRRVLLYPPFLEVIQIMPRVRRIYRHFPDESLGDGEWLTRDEHADSKKMTLEENDSRSFLYHIRFADKIVAVRAVDGLDRLRSKRTLFGPLWALWFKLRSVRKRDTNAA